MDGNHWYMQNTGNYSLNDDSHHSPDPHPGNLTGVAVDSVQNAQRLLAVYPMASATPTNHVARHMGSMMMSGAPPTFMEPTYYSSDSYAHGNPPPYSEYDQQINYLNSQQVPVNDSGFWENTRNDAVRMINEQAGPSYHYQEPMNWTPPVHHSSFQTTPFAQSVFQRTVPSSAYPTPPPPVISSSSSSLAFALGNPTMQQLQLQPPPPPQLPVQPQHQVYKQEQSPAFFEEFLDRKSQDVNSSSSTSIYASNYNMNMNNVASSSSNGLANIKRPATPPRKFAPPPEESPDPLALNYTPNIPSTTLTPRKRKSVVEMESPSVKRLQATKSTSAVSSSAAKVWKSVIPKAQSVDSMLPKSVATPVPVTPSSTSRSNSTNASAFGTPTPRRIVNKAYVEVPKPVWLTPSSSSGRKTPTSCFKTPGMSEKQRGKMRVDGVEDTPDDLGGYGSEEGSPVKRGLMSDVKTSARRTGDRDDRAPLEKLTAYIEDIFEAEDSLAPDTDPDSLPVMFSSLTVDPVRPLLHPTAVRKLTKYIGHVARPNKRLRQAGGGVPGTPSRRGRLAEVDTNVLSRLLKMLERSVRAGEDVDPFAWNKSNTAGAGAGRGSGSPKKKVAKKGKKVERRSKSRTPGEDDAEDQNADVQDARDLSDADFDKLTRSLNVARDSIIAADCIIALLGSDRLAKQLYSEELITACLNTIKNQLTKFIYPFVEASSLGSSTAPDSQLSPLLLHIVKPSSAISLADTHRQQLGETFQALSSVLPRINMLVNAESVTMSDSIIIQAVYIAIGPFFIVESGSEEKSSSKKEKEKGNVVLKTLGKSAMRGLRLDALSLIRSIFANHEDQRSWIIEEILTSLIKLSDTKQKAGQFRLRDGRSIRTVSALLLQLVQTSAHDVRLDARKIEKARQNKFALKRQESFTESQNQVAAAAEPFLDENDLEEIRLYGSGLESATKAAKTIILFLTQRSGKGKATKNSNEAEYRTIFDNLIDDLLAVLHWPEWPAAGLLLNIASKFMVSSLDDVKSSSTTDNNAARTIALDHLGVIAARIRSSMLKIHRDEGEMFKALKPLDEIVASVDIKELDKLLETHKDVASHLCKRSSEDQAYDSARELTAATLGQELAAALRQVNAWIDDPDADDDLNIKDQTKLLSFAKKIKTALCEVWKDPTADVFDIGSQEEVARIDRLAEEIGTIQSLRNSFQPILSIILLALDAPAIFMRTKALRALGQIVTSDATILAMPNVRRGIESHLLDSSPAVRDAAVELIGKYMIDTPEVAGDYYQKIADRIADTGLSVRKRVIKLLKSFYNVTSDNSRRVDIMTRLVLRMLDEDDTVKELAIKTIEDLWFPALPLPSAMKPKLGMPVANPLDKDSLQSKVAVIMGTSANFKDRQSPLEDVLHKIMAEKEGSEATSLHTRYAEICGTLIDGLVDASDLPGFTVMNCIRTIYLFTSAYPSILSGSNASTLLPYLKNATTSEELATSDYLLKIFRVSIPYMPKTAAKFGQELQQALQPMIIKPSAGGSAHILQEAVGCMCVVVRHLTHDFIRLINLVKSCNARIQQHINKQGAPELTPNDTRALLILIFIVSLLGENCDFDQLREENSALAPEINRISQGSIIEHIYDSLLKLYAKYDNGPLRARILQCLGFLFRAQPTLMTLERSTAIMDTIFASPDEDARGRLLKILQEFLLSEAAKHAAREKETTKAKPKTGDVNMAELVGNTDGFADSGVSSTVVQRYLNPILDAVLSQNPPIQAAAIDVLSFTIKQGLAHPLQSFPVIVALETSPTPALSNRASALHAILHGKHASLLNTRYILSARSSFDYQKKLASGPVKGFRVSPTPIALLQRWYSLVREKRQTRQDFLKALVKVFQENPSYQSSQDDVDFTRYMTENFATFDYKTQEEVFTVVKYLTSVLSTTGMQLLEIISPSHLLTHLHGSSHSGSLSQPARSDAMDVIPDAKNNAQSTHQDRAALMRTSVIIAMVMLLKAHLKSLYSISEDKCNKFVIGKKSAIGDKPAMKRHDSSISWDRLPFATTPLLTTEDAETQKSRFLDIWNEDGLTAEPEDDFARD
ncbi:hypothetical protein BDQ12DRAFT_682942 [Crucibulum laeve]|uniref:Sister chromatid cohesion protein n=1 Tax=Crucibulum laeve TaxID=68775 RepID=A0A5C3M371_9AGAR|nr:hypothetical protein BDQ12DRAFT_682942 [Crucibulum laeve]